jgi:hypothetical protein
MATPPVAELDTTMTVVDVTLVTTITTIQVIATASEECTATTEVVSQHEQAAATSGVATAPADLAEALAALQASCERVVEVEAQLTKVVVAALEYQNVAPPPPTPCLVDVAVPTSPLLDVDDTFEASTIVCLHTQATGVQGIRSLFPIIFDVSTHYAC